jgi:hypothetical protein
MDFHDKMVATCCGQPVKQADIGPPVGKRYATSQVAAMNNDGPLFIPVIAVSFVAK